jgi:aminoglycoside phosphotransferase (APT) family kinase protein
MKRAQPVELPADLLDDVADVVGAEVTLLGRLSGGVNGDKVRVRLPDGADAVLKVVSRADPQDLEDALRAQRVAEHMRRCGYPTPAWLGVGATATHIWQLMDFVDAPAATAMTSSLVEQLLEIVELQAGQASEPYDHWSYAWRVATRQTSAVPNEPPEMVRLRASIARLPEHSPEVAALVERLRLACTGAAPPRDAPDMVHTDLNPGNVLVRDGAVVAVVDIGNAGSGTRATDLVNLVWQSFEAPLDDVRGRLWTRILDLIGGEGAAVIAATHVLHMLEYPIREGRHDVGPELVERGHRVFDELHARQ